MSAVSSTVANSSAAAYATQLAQASSLKRSLNNIGNAIDSGNLTLAGTLLTSFINANPQYAPGASNSPTDPISKDFTTLVTAVSNKQLNAAQTAWTQVKSDLAKDGVNLSNGASSTAQLIAQNNTSTDQAILGGIFGTNSSSNSSLATLLGVNNNNSANDAGLSSSVLNSWIEGQDGGTGANSTPPTPPAPDTINNVSDILNTIA